MPMEYDPYNPSDEVSTQLITQYGDENGQIPEEIMGDFMAGKLELDDPTDSDTAGDPGDDQGSKEEAAQASEESKDEEVADTGGSGAEAEDQKGSAPDGKPDGVLAKDGKNVIPYSALEEVRSELEALKTQNAELKQLLEGNKDLEDKFDEAAAADQEAGNTQATDELLADLEEDYPGITSKLGPAILGPLQAKLDRLDELIKEKESRDEDNAKSTAQQEYDEAVAKLDSRYGETIQDDKFWEWFDKQPSYIKAAETSGVPEHFADVLKSYHAQAEQPDAGGKPSPSKDEVSDKVAKAKASAKDKPTVNSLSDIPGGNNPAEDENTALANMTPMELANKFANLSPDEIESRIARMI